MAVLTRQQTLRADALFTPLARLGVGAIAVLGAAALGAAVGLGLSQGALFLGLLAPFIVLVALARPHWAAVVYLVLVYGDLLSIMVRYDGLPPLSRFAGIGLLCTALGYRLFVERKRLVSDTVIIWMLAYGAVVALGLLYARAPDLVMGDVIEFVRNLLTFLIVINVITTSSRLHAALYTVLAAGTALASLTIFQTLTGTFDDDYGGLAQYRVSDITSSTEGARPGGSIGDANYYGQLLLILVPVALYLFFEGRTRFGRLAGLACVGILSTAVILTYSRGDALALGAIIVAALVYKRPNPLWVATGVVATGIVVTLFLPNYVARMGTVLDLASGDQQIYNQDDSILGRAGATDAAVAMFLDHPILGVGRENYPLYQLDYLAGTPYARIAKGIPPHDLYLEIAAENGVVGIVVFGALLLATFGALRDAWKRFKRSGWTTEKELVVWLAIMLIGYLVSAFSLHGAYMYIFWLQISLIAATRQIARTRSASNLPALSYEPAVNVGKSALGTVVAAQATSGAGLPTRVAASLGAVAVRTRGIAGHSAKPGAAAGAHAVVPRGDRLMGQILSKADSGTVDSLASGNTWTAVAESALRRADVKAAHALAGAALEANPYNAEAWAVLMSVRMIERPQADEGYKGYVAGSAAVYAAFLGRHDASLADYDVSERLFAYWLSNGGVPIFGYPLSPRFAEVDATQTIVEAQYFERARLEYRPEWDETPLAVRSGKLGLEAPVRGTVALQLPSGLDGEQLLFNARGLGMPTPRKFFAFWEGNGGPDVFGYPITPLLIDADNKGRPLAVQYFERVRLEYHPEFVGTPGEVQISRLGAELFARRYGGQAQNTGKR